MKELIKNVKPTPKDDLSDESINVKQENCVFIIPSGNLFYFIGDEGGT